jgi:cold shock CspA family protein/ribosome-associated translation inhibitor RaiA
MMIPVHLTGKGVTLSPEQEDQVRAAVTRLERFYDRLVACHVTVSVPNRYPDAEPIAWSFRIALTVPGHELDVTRQAKPSFREALDDAFDAARRQLQDFSRERRGDVKTPARPPRGRITKLFGQEGYGFVTADDGHEIYFHKNCVPNHGFDRLTLGVAVRYVETEGERGPQASTVVPLEDRVPGDYVP